MNIEKEFLAEECGTTVDKEVYEEQEAMNALGEMVNHISKSIKQDEEDFILEMVSAMQVTAMTMAKAKSKGIKVDDLMPRVKKAYLDKLNN